MKIALIQAHPDPAGGHFCHALAAAYAEGAAAAGHELRVVDVAATPFPLLRSKQDHERGAVPEPLLPAQEAIAWADHLVIIYPLWLGGMPALLKGFLEQVLRPGFAYTTEGGRGWTRKLRGKSARVIVTMGMPAFFYRWFFGAHGLKSLRRSILSFVGIEPVRATLIGRVESQSDAERRRWLKRVRQLGAAAR